MSKPLADILFPAASVAVYSLSGFFTKLAAGCEPLSVVYWGCLAGVVAVLGTYAVLWQLLLKRMPLSRAYMFRSLGVVYGLLIASLVFGEAVTWRNMAGCAIVLCGLWLLLSERRTEA